MKPSKDSSPKNIAFAKLLDAAADAESIMNDILNAALGAGNHHLDEVQELMESLDALSVAIEDVRQLADR